MINVEINGKGHDVEEGGTILEVINEIGISVPTLCHMKELTPTGACRLCVVEVEGISGLVPSCSYPVSDGMKIKTHSGRVIQARKTIVELLLSNHPDDCLYCERSHSCDLNDLAREYGITEKSYPGKERGYPLDVSSLGLIRDPDKCILCGKCVRVCEEVQSVSALEFIGRGSNTIVGCTFNEGLNVSSCISCGQCILVCPTGALREQSHIPQVVDALSNPKKHVVIQHAPSISVTIAEEFGMKAGTDVAGKMTTALRMMGFKRVFDSSFSADLTIIEEGSELVQRIKTGGKLPMFTSCSPGWVKFVEQTYPEYVENLSTCKSPQQMLGAIIKSYYAEKNNINPEDIYSVAIMPCTAKKFEAGRPEMVEKDGTPDIDAVLTTRELAQLIKSYSIKLPELDPEEADLPFGTRSTAGKLFGVTGGVMEAAFRSAHYLVTGKETENLKLEPVRGLKEVKKANVKIGDLELGIAVVSGLGNARQLLEEIKAGRDDIHFIEVMTCPGGCINGGGQPIRADKETIRARMNALYNIDSTGHLRKSHENGAVKELYEEFLGEPLGELSHELLHTHYKKRDVLL
ncbi:MAG: [FeFe] hydrogenase, group A [Bacteriovoracaceae bacterium]|nr:[FeFe] hydrogenase, group A [Bacteriovoracaceae bacterium]